MIQSVGRADRLLAGCDPADVLQVLANRCAEVVDAADIAVVSAVSDGRLWVAASSTGRIQVSESFGIQNRECPCTEALESGRAVINAPPATDPRWPHFSAWARAAGYQMVHAFPMRHSHQVMGVLNILDHKPTVLDGRDTRFLQTMADLAAFAVLQARARQEATALAAQLRIALDSRIIIEQAKGVLSERLGRSVEDAFVVLREYSRRTNQRMAEVAEQVVQRALPAEVIVAGAEAHTSRRRTRPRKSM